MSDRQAQTSAVFILGGGVMQLPAIQAARSLGCRVHVADGNPECPGASRADQFHHVDLRDREGLIETARGIPALKGVFTAGTDFSTSVAAVTEALGLPGIPYESSLDATDKARMRAVLAAAGLPVPRFTAIRDTGELDRSCRDLAFPLVVKPADSMGARGVRRVNDPTLLKEAVEQALPFSRSGTAIVEEFIPGQEFSLDAIVVDGKVRITGVALRHIFFPPHFVEMGHTIPAILSREDRNLLEKTFAAAVRALGINRGAAKGDLFLDLSGKTARAVVGEVAARLSGGYMSGWTYPLATGIPLTEIGIRVALGENPGDALFTPKYENYVAERALISCPGVIRAVEVPEKTPPGVEELFIRYRPGDTVRPPSNNVEKIANAIARDINPEAAEDHALRALDQIVVRLEPGNRETETFLFSRDGAGVFRRYRPLGGDGPGSLEHLPWISGNADAVLARMREERPIPVLDPEVSWQRCYPVLPAEHVLASLLERGRIELVRNGRYTDALGRLFWNAFAAAGRQGSEYVLDVLASGRVPSEAQE